MDRDRREFVLKMGAGAMAGYAGLAQAAAPPGPGGFPAKPLRLVVGYPAGGVFDAVMRALADPLSNELPQRVLTDNRPGADGRIAWETVLAAPADGYTMLAASPGLAVAEHLLPELKGKAQQVRGVCAIAAPTSVFVVPASSPLGSLKDFVSAAAAKPGFLNVPVPGIGSSIHLGQELLFDRTGVKVTNVNYKGQPQSVIDLVAGQLQFALIAVSLVLPMIKAGKLRPLAVNAATRIRSLPNVPTVAEAGYPDVLVQSWYGYAVHVKTPPPIVQYLSDQCLRVLAMPETRARLESIDAEVLALDADKFEVLIQAEFIRWGELIRRRKITR